MVPEPPITGRSAHILPSSCVWAELCDDVTPAPGLHYTADRNALMTKAPRQATLSYCKDSFWVGLT